MHGLSFLEKGFAPVGLQRHYGSHDGVLAHCGQTVSEQEKVKWRTDFSEADGVRATGLRLQSWTIFDTEARTVLMPRTFDGSQDPVTERVLLRHGPLSCKLHDHDRASEVKIGNHIPDWDYVDKFNAFMEDIDDMSVEDQFFHFMIERLVEPLPSNPQWGDVAKGHPWADRRAQQSLSAGAGLSAWTESLRQTSNEGLLSGIDKHRVFGRTILVRRSGGRGPSDLEIHTVELGCITNDSVASQETSWERLTPVTDVRVPTFPHIIWRNTIACPGAKAVSLADRRVTGGQLTEGAIEARFIVADEHERAPSEEIEQGTLEQRVDNMESAVDHLLQIRDALQTRVNDLTMQVGILLPLDVQHLQDALAAVDRLLDFKSKGSNHKAQQSGSKSSQAKKNWLQRVKDRPSNSKSNKGKATKTTTTTPGKTDRAKKPVKCFISQGPHYARDCPQHTNLHAARAKPTPRNDPTTGALQMLGALQGEATSHNFIKASKAKEIGLGMEPIVSQLKAINSAAKSVHGAALDVALSVGEWHGKIEFMAILMDDFEVILGQLFLPNARVATLQYGGYFNYGSRKSASCKNNRQATVHQHIVGFNTKHQ
eukprot:Gb_41042 [translate_table: standard]